MRKICTRRGRVTSVRLGAQFEDSYFRSGTIISFKKQRCWFKHIKID